MKWAYSETLMHPVRVPNVYDIKPSGGLFVAQPRFEVRKMNPFFKDQWVLCRWEAPMPEARWRAMFGDQMVWPRGGEYYPTNMALPQGVVPDITWTERVIAAERERRSKNIHDHEAEVERGTNQLERSESSRIESILHDCFTAFGKVPGSNSGGVSLPNPHAKPPVTREELHVSDH